MTDMRSDEFEPLAQQQLAEPHSWLERARWRTPVFYMPEMESPARLVVH